VWDPWVRDAKTLCVQTIRGHEGTITGLAVHGRLLLSCSTDQTLRVWQMDEGRELLLYPWYSLQETLHDHDCWINAISLALTGESGELFVADERGAISVYQLTIRGRQTSLTRWQQHPAVHALGISQMLLVGHENLLITIAFDQTMRALNLSTGQPIVTVANPNRARYCGAHWHSPSRQLFLVDEHGFAFVWSIHAERCVKEERLLGPGALAASPASFVSVSAAGDEMLACEASGCHVWRCVRNLGYKEVAGHAGPVIALHVAEGAGGGTEGLLYSASLDNTIKAWDPYDMSCVSTLREGYSEMSCLLVSSTNGFLISGNDDGSIRLWNPDSGSTINLLEHTNTVTCLDACVRGRSELLLSAGFDGHVAVWDITKRKHSMPQIETVFAAHAPHEILALRANPHNETILTAGNDAVIKVWSWHTYALLATLSGHADAVTALCLDGNFLLSGSDDCTVKVWDTHTNTVRLLRERRARARVACSLCACAPPRARSHFPPSACLPSRSRSLSRSGSRSRAAALDHPRARRGGAAAARRARERLPRDALVRVGARLAVQRGSDDPRVAPPVQRAALALPAAQEPADRLRDGPGQHRHLLPRRGHAHRSSRDTPASLDLPFRFAPEEAGAAFLAPAHLRAPRPRHRLATHAQRPTHAARARAASRRPTRPRLRAHAPSARGMRRPRRSRPQGQLPTASRVWT
jgi:WD40 repeat protein